MNAIQTWFRRSICFVGALLTAATVASTSQAHDGYARVGYYGSPYYARQNAYVVVEVRPAPAYAYDYCRQPAKAVTVKTYRRTTARVYRYAY